MSREFISTPFFETPSSSSIFTASKIPIEYFLADSLMRHDVSRIIWSSDAYMFRRRMETTAAENLTEYSAMSLNLPFINYWYSGFWEPDDRPFSQSTQQMVFGTWEEGLPYYLKSMPVKTTFTATAVFGREDDARIAYNRLMWEFRPKGPILLATTVIWHNKEIVLPVYLTMDQPQFNPTFNEVNWLSTQRILPIKFNFTARTYLLLPETQKLITGVSSDDSTPPFNTKHNSTSDDVDEITISDHVILEFAALKNLGEDLPEDSPINPYTTLIVSGIIESAELDMTCSVSNITSTTAKVQWTIDSEDTELFEYLEVLVPGQDVYRVEGTSISELEIQNLSPSSTYDITVLAHTVDGNVKTYKLTIQTLDTDNNVGNPLETKKGRLKGMEW